MSKLERSEATIYSVEIDNVGYRLILQDHTYELLQEEVGYEEGGDAESGPRMYTYTKGYTLIACGCGYYKCSDEEIAKLIAEEVAYFKANPAVLDRHLI